MVELPALTRAYLDIAPNSRRAVLHYLARNIARDLGRTEAGILSLFEPNRMGVRVTPLPNNILLIDGYLPSLDQPYFTIGRLNHPVLFGTNNLTHTRLIAVLLSSEGDEAVHLQRVHRLSRILHDPSILSGLLTATTSDAVQAVLMMAPIVHRAA